MPGSHSKKDKLKKKIAKVRKADQQDINRVKRWNSRSFNKKKELSGPTEPVFKPTAATNPLTGRPHPGMKGDELTAKLRNRLAKIRKADGGVAPNYNNPSKVRKKKTTTKAAGLGALGEGKLNRKTGKPMKLKPRKITLDEFESENQIDEKARKKREFKYHMSKEKTDYFVEEIRANIIYHNKIFPLVGMIAGAAGKVGAKGAKIGGEILDDMKDVGSAAMQGVGEEAEEQ